MLVETHTTGHFLQEFGINQKQNPDISVRLTAWEEENMDADARMKNIPTGTATAAYISAGVRRSQFPAVEFRWRHTVSSLLTNPPML